MPQFINKAQVTVPPNSESSYQTVLDRSKEVVGKEKEHTQRKNENELFIKYQDKHDIGQPTRKWPEKNHPIVKSNICREN